MSSHAILLPLLLQILLTLFAYALLTAAKSKAAKAGLVNEERRSLHDDAWPDSVVQINNNIRNQFELPVLFYVLIIVLWQLKVAGAFEQSVAWLFALSRVLHLYVHTGSNYVPLRRKAFTFGAVMVLILCGDVVYRLAVAQSL